MHKSFIFQLCNTKRFSVTAFFQWVTERGGSKKLPFFNYVTLKLEKKLSVTNGVRFKYNGLRQFCNTKTLKSKIFLFFFLYFFLVVLQTHFCSLNY